MALVKIGEETFSIKDVPPSDSQLVLKEKEILLGAVDLPTLVTDLGRVGRFVRIAYNGVAGIDTDLQIEIRAIGVDVTKLCDKSAITVSRFKTASTSVLARLKSTYGFLTGGFEKMALVTLKAVSEVCKDMATAADELHSDFNEESKRVEKAVGSTIKAKGKQKVEMERIDKERVDMQAKKVKAEEARKNAIETYGKREEEYQAAIESEIDHEERANLNPLKKVANAFCSPFGKRPYDNTGDKIQAAKARELQLKKLEDMSKLDQERREALQDIEEFTERLKQCKGKDDLADAAIGSLHSAMDGLQKLSVVMMKAALFWKQVQQHCDRLAKDDMQTYIATAMEMPKSERLEFWKDPVFLQGAVEYYGRWVALDDVCGIYMDKIKETQKDLYSYLTENPTDKEARENVEELAKQFCLELAEEQEKIKQKEFANKAEMAKLMAES